MSFALRKIESIYRMGLLSFPKKNIFANALINEYPKSGGTWLAHMISEISEVPFPENEFPKEFPALFHGHFKASFKHIPTVVLWRDPRDIMVSWYYHRLIPNSHTSSAAVEKTRGQLNFNDYNDISTNLAPFIDYCFTVKSFPRFSWADFYDKWFDEDHHNVTHTSYELLSTQTAIELKKIMSFLDINVSEEKIDHVIEKNSFANKAKRPAGIENNSDFLRKGVVGDWKNVFNDEAYQVLKLHTEHRLDKYQERFIKQ